MGNGKIMWCSPKPKKKNDRFRKLEDIFVHDDHHTVIFEKCIKMNSLICIVFEILDFKLKY